MVVVPLETELNVVTELLAIAALFDAVPLLDHILHVDCYSRRLWFVLGVELEGERRDGCDSSVCFL